MEIHKLTSAFLTFMLCSSCFAEQNLSLKYKFSAQLSGEDYVLYWNTNLVAKMIEFAVNVSTTGWVGFGLSANGQMPGSDVVIGWIDNTGELIFHDRYAASRSLPAINSNQDWFATKGFEENGRTILEFYRNFTTCDTKYDLDVEANTARVIWSYSYNDPDDLYELGQLEHSKKGSSSLNLFGGNSEDYAEKNSSSIKIFNENVLIPNDEDTTYWCTVHEIPAAIEEKERYIYKISPVIHGPAAKFVHHIVAYMCTTLNDSHVGVSQKCVGAGNIDIDICLKSGVLFAAWAVGGTDYIFPKGVGYPFGGKTNQYIVLELHYDNPHLKAGVIDNSGFELFYVDEEPTYRAGLLTFGHSSTSSLMIPPRASNYVVNSVCPEQCTQEFFPREGINIFANLLHTHLAGHGMEVKHLRRTNSCSGLEELPPVDKNMKYDFNYQQVTQLPKTVTILPGDILHLECSYRTTDSVYQNIVLGGESTREEMCFSLLYYYPEVDLSYCIGAQQVSDQFMTRYFNESTRIALKHSIRKNNYEEVKSIFKEMKWTSETVEQFQTSVHSNSFHSRCISTSNTVNSIYKSFTLPDVKCPYVPPTRDCPSVSAVDDAAEHQHLYFPLMSVSLLFIWSTF